MGVSDSSRLWPAVHVSYGGLPIRSKIALSTNWTHMAVGFVIEPQMKLKHHIAWFLSPNPMATHTSTGVNHSELWYSHDHAIGEQQPRKGRNQTRRIIIFERIGGRSALIDRY